MLIFEKLVKILIVISSGSIFLFMINLLSNFVFFNLSSFFSSTTPDSLIESGSDSASAIVSKKDNVHSSEFGSLNSLNVAQEDDLDSGVGLRQPNLPFNNSEGKNNFDQ